MSLNDIKLEPVLVQELYKRSLVDINIEKKKTVSSKATFSFLGNNKKGIAIVISSKEAIHLPDEALNFLLGILSACKLSMEDVAILNVEKNKEVTYQSIASELKANTVLLFGVTAASLELPIQFPDYQIQRYNNQVYLSAPTLSALEKDKVEKVKLWNCLKQVFGI
ncbi:hypothetical protein ACQ33O_06500 [Ferruginibacter sp. SUN002]|uniref:hypothetical protein n=1 Tax=Ferruginibacter sp. SUN002 TaxID=2937789 RepID=UPI003D368604